MKRRQDMILVFFQKINPRQPFINKCKCSSFSTHFNERILMLIGLLYKEKIVDLLHRKTGSKTQAKKQVNLASVGRSVRKRCH